MTAGDVGKEVPAEVPGESTTIETNGITLHAVEAGPETGDLIVLLHGFPEFWYGWHAAITPLVEAGYRVVVPDQRGYNRSDKPDEVRAYRIQELAADVLGVFDAYGAEDVALAGHDWGGVVGWWLALHHPERLSAFIPVNAPHPTVIRERLTRDPMQVVRTSHALFFQLPVLPEAVSRAFDWRLTVRGMRETARPGTFTEADFRRYRRAWEREDAFSYMLNWYRATARQRPAPETDEVTVPTRVLWGARDRFLKRSMATASVDYCVDGRLSLFHEATHWVQHEEPRSVAEDILAEIRPEPT